MDIPKGDFMQYRRSIDIDVAKIIQRIDDLIISNNYRFDVLEKKVDLKCINCAFGKVADLRDDNHWWHIERLWWAICFAYLAMGTLIGFYLKFHVGH